tara:strand:- start:46 stop:246 length:201 start_codon:yes stop_codon:yes gene_type:complete
MYEEPSIARDEADETVPLRSSTIEPPPAGAALVQADPVEVRRFPLVDGATDVMAEVPAPTKTDAAV